MKRILLFILTFLLITGIVIGPVKTYAYEYTGGVSQPDPPSDSSQPSDENKVFNNDLISFTVNSPWAKKTYSVGESITLSITPERYYYTVLPGGFTASYANDIIMEITLGSDIVKTFAVSYYNDALGKTYTDSFIPTKEGTYVIHIKYRGTNRGNYSIQVVKGNKKSNTMVVKAKTKTVKYSKVKKKSVTVKPLTVKKAKGKVIYTKLSGNKKISVNKKTGKFVVKKGIKRGTYKIKVKIKDTGNSKFMPETINKTVKIRVK